MRSFEGTVWDPESRRWLKATPEVIERRKNYAARKPRRAIDIPHSRRNQSNPGVATSRFAPELLSAVIDAAPPGTQRHREAMIQWLARIDFDIKQPKNELTASVLKLRLHAIGAAAIKITQLLRYDRLPDQLLHALWAMADEDGEPDPDARLHEIIEGILQLQRWSKDAEKLKQSAEGKSTAERDLNIALAGILSIWTKVLKQKVKTSTTPNGRASGPLLRFTQACLKALQIKRVPEQNALQRRIQRMRTRQGMEKMHKTRRAQI